MKINFFRHSFFKISGNGVNILIDPYTNENKCKPDYKELVKCPDLGQHLSGIDLILLTHEHFDHFEKETVEKIANENHSFVVGNEELLKTLNIPTDLMKPAKGFETLNIKNAGIECFPAHHHNSFYPLSYLVKIGNESVFHAGDTELVDYFSKIRPTVALLPIGGSVTMDVVDAVRAIKMMKPDYAIPMHYDTWESIKADPNEFKAKIEKSILKTKAVILKPGQSFTT